MSEDIRWKQRFDNYLRAFQTLRRAVELAAQRDLSELEQQGLVQGFEFTHELAWKVLNDYMEEQGVAGIIGSKNATREAFKNGLIDDGEAWMEMIKARNLSKHTYNPETAEEIVEGILTRFYPAFEQLARKFTSLAEQTGNDGFGAVKTTWDHAHRMNKVDPYEFESAEQLLEDFWNEVDKILNEGKR